MQKNLTALLLFIFSIAISSLLWDHISFSVDEKKLINIFYDLDNLINPINDPVRFIIFLLIPFTFIFFYFGKKNKYFYKNFIKILNLNYLRNNNSLTKTKELNLFTCLILFILILEFLSLNFNKFQNDLDFFHEGMWLTASNNLALSGNLWSSSNIVRGFFADFFPFYLWEYFGKETIGITRFFKLFIFFLNKVLLIMIARKLSLFTNFPKNTLILFFLILSTLLISLQGYVNPIFLTRSFLLLLFIIIFLNFIGNSNKNLHILILGLFSSISFFWYIDIAIYINVILLILLFYFFFNFKFKKMIILFLSIAFGWLIFFLKLPSHELFYFFENLNLILSTLGWMHYFNFPTPFISLDGRSGKSIVIFLLTGYLIINFINFLKKDNQVFLFSMIFLFLTALLYFNYGLGRSDGGHIRIATSILYIPFFTISLFYIFEKLKNKLTIKLFKFQYLIVFVFIFFTASTLFINKKFEEKNILNIFTSQFSMNKIINDKDEEYLSLDYIKFISYYQNLVKKDDCVMIFTNELALYYLLKKQSCSNNYFMWIARPKNIQKKIIKDLKEKKPSYLVYRSEKDLFYDSNKTLKEVNKFIIDNYIFYEKFNKWEIYKKSYHEKN